MKTRKISFVKTIVSLSSVLVGMTAFAVNAQIYQGNQQDYITIYEHCDYEGDSRALSVGDYENMRGAGIGNDRMSSIRVPDGFTVTIFEDDNFRGDSVRILNDIKCFDKKWNDRTSSLKVASKNNRNYQAPPDYGNDNRDYRNNNRPARRNVSGRNVSRVVFGNQVLQQTSKAEWQMSSARSRSGSVQLQEVSRDDNTVLLQNNFTAQRVRIDLFINDVTIVNRSEQPQHYGITDAQIALESTPRGNGRIPVRGGSPNTVLKGPCFNYKAYTRGGSGAVRFHGHKGYHRYNNKAFSGRLCEKGGKVTMAINKTQPGTDAIVEIQGRTFRFAPNEKADSFRANWYTKFVELVIK